MNEGLEQLLSSEATEGSPCSWAVLPLQGQPCFPLPQQHFLSTRAAGGRAVGWDVPGSCVLGNTTLSCVRINRAVSWGVPERPDSCLQPSGVGWGTGDSFSTHSETENIFSSPPPQSLYCFLGFFQINSTVLKEDLKRMVENFYAALFGYDEVRRLFSGDVQQADHLIPEHRTVQMGKTFTVHFFEELSHQGSSLESKFLEEKSTEHMDLNHGVWNVGCSLYCFTIPSWPPLNHFLPLNPVALSCTLKAKRGFIEYLQGLYVRIFIGST